MHHALSVKGVEGFVSERLRKGTIREDSFARALAGVCMVTGYIITEALALGIPIEEALLEIPANSLQVVLATTIKPQLLGLL